LSKQLPEGSSDAAQQSNEDKIPSIALHAFVGAAFGYFLVEIVAGLVTGLVIGPIREDLALGVRWFIQIARHCSPASADHGCSIGLCLLEVEGERQAIEFAETCKHHSLAMNCRPGG
jgi:hypothetical protein